MQVTRKAGFTCRLGVVVDDDRSAVRPKSLTERLITVEQK